MGLALAKLSVDEFKRIVEDVVEEKLLEILGDPDRGMVIRTNVQRRLKKQLKAVAAGERGQPVEQVICELGLE